MKTEKQTIYLLLCIWLTSRNSKIALLLQTSDSSSEYEQIQRLLTGNCFVFTVIIGIGASISLKCPMQSFYYFCWYELFPLQNLVPSYVHM